MFKQVAEHIVELTNDEEWESYRHHTLSTMSKIAELPRQCSQIERKQVGKGSLNPIVSEINDAIKSDPIVGQILQSSGFEPSDYKLLPSSSTEELRNTALLLNDLIFSKYRAKCESEITRISIEVGSKSRLWTITKLYVSYLYGAGFSRRYIHSCALDHFYSNRVTRCTEGLLTSFFGKFDEGQKTAFQVVVPVKQAMADFLCDLFSIEQYDKLEDFLPKSTVGTNGKFGSGKRHKLVVFPGIQGYDSYSALRVTDSLLSMARAFVSLHPSAISPGITATSFVVSEKTRKGEVITGRAETDPRKIMRSRTADTEGPRALASYVFSRGPRSQDGSRIFNSLSSLSLSISAESPESRLLSIWAAYEALLPEPSKDGDKALRITHFVPLVVPSVSIGYLRQTFNECYKNCSEEYGADFVRIVEGFAEGDSTEEKFARVLASEDAVRKPLFDAVADSPLLLLRLWKLARMLEEPRLALEYLEKHLLRVEWQMHRIYRARNSIVHRGAKSPIVGALVENAYSYYRALFLALEKSSSVNGVSQPNRALELVGRTFTVRKNMLERIVKNSGVSKEQRTEDFLRLVFSS